MYQMGVVLSGEDKLDRDPFATASRVHILGKIGSHDLSKDPTTCQGMWGVYHGKCFGHMFLHACITACESHLCIYVHGTAHQPGFHHGELYNEIQNNHNVHLQEENMSRYPSHVLGYSSMINSLSLAMSRVYSTSKKTLLYQITIE